MLNRRVLFLFNNVLLLCLSFVAAWSSPTDTTGIKAGGIIDFLTRNHGVIRGAIYRYDGTRLLDSVKLDLGPDAQNIKSGGNQWICSMRSAAVNEQRGVIDLEMSFQLKEGVAPQTAVGLELTFDRWSADNYVVMPGAVYGGNRFRIRPMNYPPFLTDPKDLGPNIPVTVSDIPHLAAGAGPSEIEEQTGNMATPALGWQSFSLKQGFWLLTTQGSAWGNHGIGIRESADRKQCVIKVVAPRMRSRRATINGPVESPDRAPDWKAGEEASIHLRLHFFPATTIQTLFDRFADIRRELLPGAAPAPSVPMSCAWQAVAQALNEHNWDDKALFYRNGVQFEQGKISLGPAKLSGFFSLGWCGGAMNTLAMLMADDELARQRAWRSLDRIITQAQGPSGFYYTYPEGSGWVGDGPAKRQPTDPNLILVRRSADLLYFYLKQMMLLEQSQAARPVPPAWKEHVKRLADAFVTLWKREGQFGQYLSVTTGEIKIGATSSAALAPAALALAAEYFKNPEYLDVARASARQFYQRDVRAGYTTGGPGDALQAPDSESAYSLLESFVVLYEMTGEQEWLRDAGEQARQFMSWVVSYDYAWPKDSTCAKLAQPTVGTMWANAQNKCPVIGICTASGDALFKLYRATGDRRYLELLREIYRVQSRWVSLSDRPLTGRYKGAKNVQIPAGWIYERAQMGDWEIPGSPVGEIPVAAAIWSQSAVLLAWTEVPGLYIQPDSGFVYAIDHIEATGRRTSAGFRVEIKNPTAYPAQVRILCEPASNRKKALGVNTMSRRPLLTLAPGERKAIVCDKAGGVRPVQ